MKIIIVDDEPLARERLALLIAEINDQYIIDFAGNGLQAIEQFNKSSADIILMDIRMPGMDGLEAARHLSDLDNPPAIIFTTAFDEYALDAFKSEAVDYLLKPMRKELLEKALKKCSKLNKLQLEQLALRSEETYIRTHIAAQIRGNILLIATADIACFLADHKYTTVQYYKNNIIKETIIEDTLKSLEQEFAEDFLRIHRNALIKKQKIESLEKKQDGGVFVHLKNMPGGIEVSRRHVAELRRCLKN
ncbi:MAG: DNA-binding response regulator [Gammaproteobacteria bacterium]|nr:MAG: DNA-binding response regulator [Gammaproteobacteria bacterium]